MCLASRLPPMRIILLHSNGKTPLGTNLERPIKHWWWMKRSGTAIHKCSLSRILLKWGIGRDIALCQWQRGESLVTNIKYNKARKKRHHACHWHLTWHLQRSKGAHDSFIFLFWASRMPVVPPFHRSHGRLLAHRPCQSWRTQKVKNSDLVTNPRDVKSSAY